MVFFHYLRRSYTGIGLLFTFIFIAFYMVSLTQYPLIVTDEPWYASTAYNWISGQGLTNTSCGWRGGDELFIYTLLLGAGLKLGGTTLFMGRLVSVCLGVLALWGALTFAKDHRFSPRVTIAFLTLMTVSNMVFIVFRRVRPEALLAVLLVWGIVYLGRFFLTSSYRNIGLGILFIGLSAFSHPLGVFMAISAVGALLLASVPWRQKWISLLISTGTLLGLLLLYAGAWQILKPDSLVQFVKVALFESDRLSTPSTLWDTFYYNATVIFPAYVLGVKRAYIVMIECVILSMGLLYYKRRPFIGFLSIFTISFLILSFFLMTYFFRVGFIVPHLIVLFMMGIFLSDLLESSSLSVWIKRGVIVLVSLYGLNHFAGNVWMLVTHRQVTPYESVASIIDTLIPDDAVVLTHLPFWFGLKSNAIYHNNTHFPAKPYTGFQDTTLHHDLEYAVLTDAFATDISPTTGQKEYLYGGIPGYYPMAMDIVTARQARLIATISTVGYGTIHIYNFQKNID